MIDEINLAWYFGFPSLGTDRTRSATIVAAPSSPYGILDQEEISEANEKNPAMDDNTTDREGTTEGIETTWPQSRMIHSLERWK